MSKNLQLKIQDNIDYLVFNLQDEKVNKLSEKILIELDDILEKIKKNLKLKALIISSAKKNIFIAGADINEIKEITNKKEALKKVTEAQNIFFKDASTSPLKSKDLKFNSKLYFFPEISLCASIKSIRSLGAYIFIMLVLPRRLKVDN